MNHWHFSSLGKRQQQTSATKTLFYFNCVQLQGNESQRHSDKKQTNKQKTVGQYNPVREHCPHPTVLLQ